MPTPSRRPRIIAVATVVVLSILAVGHGAEISHAQPSSTRQPRFTYLGQPTAEAKEIIAWAVSRYRSAGLQLPDLTVSFPTFCGGRAALYHVGERSIEFCQITRRNALHEFAHAWDDTSGAVDREAFLKLRGLKVWFGGLEVPSREQGCEQLANTIAWGLMDAGVGGVPDFPANSVSQLTKAFTMLTGGVKPRQTAPPVTHPS